MAFREIQESSSRLGAFAGLVKSWLRGLFLEDWILKLIALLITLGLWYGVTGQRTPATVRIPGVQLNYRVPPQMEISNDPRREIEVTLTGAERLLNRINSRDLVAYVDLSDYQPGERSLKLTRERVSMGLPEGVRIDDIDPNTIPLRLEPRVEKTVDVTPRTEGSMAEGFELRAVNAMPHNVRLRGPASHVNMLDKASTEVIRVDGRREGFSVQEVAVEVSDPKVDVLDPIVNVRVEIGERRIEKAFSGVPVTVESGGTPRPFRATVLLYGPKSVLDQLQASSLKIVLRDEGNGGVTPHLVLPPGTEDAIELRSTKPAGFAIVY